MRIELRTPNSMVIACDTQDMELLGKWFASWVPEMVKSAQNRIPWQIQLWPMDETEYAYFQNQDRQQLMRPQFVNSNAMRELVKAFEDAADVMERVENRTK